MLDVAIVDDEEDVRAELGQMVRRFCAQEGERVAVREYADGAELLDAAAASAHDVILLDIEMSQVDGMDARPRAASSRRGCPDRLCDQHGAVRHSRLRGRRL